MRHALLPLIRIKAMDNSHVALVALLLRADGFSPFRCDRNLSLGINVGSMAKILKCAGSEDQITLTASDEGNTLSFLFEGSMFVLCVAGFFVNVNSCACSFVCIALLAFRFAPFSF